VQNIENEIGRDLTKLR